MRNRGAYLTKERMPSDSKQTPLAAWKAVPDWRCTALQAEIGDWRYIPRTSSFLSYVRGYE